MKTTKRSKNYTMMLTGLASINLTLPAGAIENPAIEDGPKHKEAHNKDVAVEQGAREKGNIKEIAWIGLGGAPVSEALASHLGLEPGMGVTIFHVVPGSPAKKAGFKMHDVITEFDEKKMASFEDLRNAVSSRNPGDEVTIKFIQKGKVVEKKVVLGKRSVLHHQQKGFAEPEANPLWRGMGHLPKGQRERINEMMKKRIEEMRDQLEKNGGVEFDMKEFFIDPPGNLQLPPQGDHNNLHKKFSFNAQTSITLMDDEGSVTVQSINGKREVIVKNKEGEVMFEGPYQTEQDKAAVPDNIRGRLDKINIDGFHFGVLPQPDDPPQLREEE